MPSLGHGRLLWVCMVGGHQQCAGVHVPGRHWTSESVCKGLSSEMKDFIGWTEAKTVRLTLGSVVSGYLHSTHPPEPGSDMEKTNSYMWILCRCSGKVQRKVIGGKPIRVDECRRDEIIAVMDSINKNDRNCVILMVVWQRV